MRREIFRRRPNHGHLPKMPTQSDIARNGLNVAEVQMLSLEKIEELTLLAIEQNKLIQQQSGEIDALKAQIQRLAARSSNP